MQQLINRIEPKFKLNIKNNSLLVKGIIGFICFIVTFIIVMSGAAPEKYDLEIDDISQTDILAPVDVVDKLTTESLIEEATSKVALEYDFDQDVRNQSQQKIYDFLSQVQIVRQMPEITIDEKVEKLKEFSVENIPLSDENLALCITMSDNVLLKMQVSILDTQRQIMDHGVEVDALEDARNEIKRIIQQMDLSMEIKNLSYVILEAVIEPNKVYNEQKTQEALEKARDSVQPKMYKKGEKIIGNGERVHVEQFEVLKQLDLIENSKNIDLRFPIGTFMLVFLLLSVIVGYLYFFKREFIGNINDLTLLGLIFIVALSAMAFLKYIPDHTVYLLPIITAAMLITILLDTKLAIIVNLILSLLGGLIIKADIGFISIILLSGTFSAFTLAKVYQRSKMVIDGLIISLINILLVVSLGLLAKYAFKVVVLQALGAVLYSLLAIFITIGILPFLEASFNIVTPLKLLELSNPNQPLIKKLLLEAPGTYHHSLMVGNLSETATEAIGGNALLARAAAYYHDIGKLKRPYFFKENQLDDNPHDRMTPNLSTLVITSHTKDGVEMAKEHKIPLLIRDIIDQHHGTTMVAYFYDKAKKGEKSELVELDDFRYEGPKPQTKEAAVVMLADCVEAAVRSMSERTEGKIEGLVRKIIKDKLNDGQLDMCDLTLKDLDTIAKAFLRVLSGYYHERIEYPELKVKETL